MKVLIKKIHSYYSTEEENIIEWAKQAEQIILLKGKDGPDEVVKVVMVIK